MATPSPARKRQRLERLEIRETSGVNSPANRSQVGGPAGWIVMRSDGTPPDPETLAKAGMSACTQKDCSKFVLANAAKCSDGHTQEDPMSKADTPTLQDVVTRLTKAEEDVEALRTENADLKAALEKAADPTDPIEDPKPAAKADPTFDGLPDELVAALKSDDVPDVVKTALRKSAAQAAEDRKRADDAVAKADSLEEATALRSAITKAEGLDGLTIEPSEFGAVLRSCERLLPPEVNTKLDEVLRAASDTLKASALLKEVGGGAFKSSTAWEAIEAAATDIQKSDTSLTREQAIDTVYRTRTDLVDAYRKEQ